MKVVVMGAGAVGCYYGGLLARAGHEVVLIGRQPHVAAIQRSGLRIQTAAFDEQVRLQASTEAGAVDGAQLVLFCVKSPDTESAGSLMARSLPPDALVLCLQQQLPWRADAPARERPRDLDHVLLRVDAAHAERVELHELARVILVQAAGATLSAGAVSAGGHGERGTGNSALQAARSAPSGPRSQASVPRSPFPVSTKPSA